MAGPKNDRKPFHVAVAERLIDQLKQGTAPWQKPWDADGVSALPVNPISGKRYRGVNALNLAGYDYNDNRWMTYKQAASMGAQIRKGERGTPVQYWQYEEQRAVRDASGQPLKDGDGNTVTQTVQLERPRAFYAVVFNAEQIDGLPPAAPRPKPDWVPVERAESILDNSGVRILERAGDRAYYQPSNDTITLPERGQFSSADRFYATALHELAHASGHASRLARDLSHPFGSTGYAKEELRAEIASLLVGQELRIGHDPEQHAAYVNSWIAILENDPLEIVRACADAEKILSHVMGLEHKRVLALPEAADIAFQAEEQAFDAAANTPIESLFEDDTLTFEHFASFQGAGETSLAAAMQGHGLKNLGDVVGADRNYEAMFNTAVERLSPLFGLAPTSTGDGPDWPAYLERKGLASAAAEHVEGAMAQIKLGQRSKDMAQAPRNYLNVPYAERREAKEAGAAWDATAKSWYIPQGVESAPLSRWIKEASDVREQIRSAPDVPAPKEGQGQAIQTEQKPERAERIILAVPFADKEAAKAAGARWDRKDKCWYVLAGQVDPKSVEKWKIDPTQVRQERALSPQEEFAEAMRHRGLTVPPGHPIMDGSKQRVPTVDDKGKERSGFYFAFGNDAVPGGYIMNNRTQEETRWRASGIALSPEEKAQALAKMVQEREIRAQQQQETFENTAQRLQKQLERYSPIEKPSAYHVSKGIGITKGAYTDSSGNAIILPAIDTSGKHWTTQYIQPGGEKVFAKDSVKEGHFHVVNGGIGQKALEALDKAPVIIIGEGYATATSISEAVGYATVAGFDSGNLPAVAEALRARYPDKPFLIAADDDQRVFEKHGHNPGVDKASKAAEVSRGAMIVPVFATGEQAGDKKSFTDFNDLSVRSSLGREGLVRQLDVGIAKATQLQSAWTLDRRQTRDEGNRQAARNDDVKLAASSIRR